MRIAQARVVPPRHARGVLRTHQWRDHERGGARSGRHRSAPATSEPAPWSWSRSRCTNFGPAVNTAIHPVRDRARLLPRRRASTRRSRSRMPRSASNLDGDGPRRLHHLRGQRGRRAVRGVPIKVVFATADRPLWWMYSRPASITTVAGLRGKKVGTAAPVPRRRSSCQILQKYGIGPDDTKLVNLGAPQRLAALEAGAVDAGFLVAPTNLLAESAGFRQLFNSKDEGILLITEGLATGDAFLAEKPDVVRRMLRGSLRAVRGMQTDRAGAIDTVARFTGDQPGGGGADLRVRAGDLDPDGTAEPTILRQSIEIMKLTAQVEGPVPEDQVFDLRMARGAGGAGTLIFVTEYCCVLAVANTQQITCDHLLAARGDAVWSQRAAHGAGETPCRQQRLGPGSDERVSGRATTRRRWAPQLLVPGHVVARSVGRKPRRASRSAASGSCSCARAAACTRCTTSARTAASRSRVGRREFPGTLDLPLPRLDLRPGDRRAGRRCSPTGRTRRSAARCACRPTRSRSGRG